jgi:hypothetical protein
VDRGTKSRKAENVWTELEDLQQENPGLVDDDFGGDCLKP